jgi:hypothetical protein
VRTWLRWAADDAKAERHKRASHDDLTNLQTGYSDGSDFLAGTFGRAPLTMMREVGARVDLDGSRIAFLLRSDTAHEVPVTNDYSFVATV